MTARIAPCAPLEASRRARWFRMYAAIAETPQEHADRMARAEAYQALAVCGSFVDDAKKADGGHG